MSLHYYLSLFPTEALIASELDPGAFGVYMATASHRGSSEPTTIIEIEGEFGDDFDWQFAKEKCAATETPKNSVYLSIYRTLEHIPLTKLGTLYLVTRDGRSLPLEPELIHGDIHQTEEFYLYQELCPVRPVVVTTLGPLQFSAYMVDEETKIHLPRIAFADLKVIDLDNINDAGNIGCLYHQNITHLKNCIESVIRKKTVGAKTLDRARVESFTYNLINTGIYIGDKEGMMYYRMKSPRELDMYHHAWGKSALIC
jgi:hypothetical protein